MASRRTLLLLALLMFAAALAIGYIGFIRAPGLRAPPAIAYLVALICVVTAARLFECGSSIAGLAVITGGGGGACRVGFGIAAGICTVLAIFCLWRLLGLRIVRG